MFTTVLLLWYYYDITLYDNISNTVIYNGYNKNTGTVQI